MHSFRAFASKGSLEGLETFARQSNQIENVLNTAWQVLASVLGLSFVIVFFLMEFADKRLYESRALPIFIARTASVFIVLFGLNSVVSMGFSALVLSGGGMAPGWQAAIVFYNLILFTLNMVLIGFLYMRTFQLLRPSLFRQVLHQYNRQLILDNVNLELRERLATRALQVCCQENGLKFSWFTPYDSAIPSSGQAKDVKERSGSDRRCEPQLAILGRKASPAVRRR